MIRIEQTHDPTYTMEAWLDIRQTIKAIIRRIRGDQLYFSDTNSMRFLELFRIYGPLKVMIYPSEGEGLWPEGRVLMGTRIEKVNTFDEGSGFVASMDVKWEHDRPIRTGWKRRIFGL